MTWLDNHPYCGPPSSISIRASRIERSSSALSSTRSRFSFGFATDFLVRSGRPESQECLDRDLIFLELTVKRGPSDTQQVRRYRAVALGVFEGVENGAFLHLDQWHNRKPRARARRRVERLFLRHALPRRKWSGSAARRHCHRLAPFRDQMILNHRRQ